MNLSVLFFIFIVAIIIFILIKFAKIYSISVSDFKSLFTGMSNKDLLDITAIGPNHVTFKYEIYPIDSIPCYDKKGNQINLKNNPGLEIQFTDIVNKKTSIYFDTIRIHGVLITGSASRYLGSLKRTVDLSKVQKIEIRNIKKGFKYLKDPFV